MGAGRVESAVGGVTAALQWGNTDGMTYSDAMRVEEPRTVIHTVDNVAKTAFMTNLSWRIHWSLEQTVVIWRPFGWEG